MNGFLKLKESLLKNGLCIQSGKLIIEPHFSLKLDPQKVEKYAIDHKTYS